MNLQLPPQPHFTKPTPHTHETKPALLSSTVKNKKPLSPFNVQTPNPFHFTKKTLSPNPFLLLIFEISQTLNLQLRTPTHICCAHRHETKPVISFPLPLHTVISFHHTGIAKPSDLGANLSCKKGDFGTYCETVALILLSLVRRLNVSAFLTSFCVRLVSVGFSLFCVVVY